MLWPLTILGLVLPIWYLVKMKRDRELSDTEQSRVSAYIWFFVVAAVFWGIYDQTGSTLTLFAQNDTTNTLFGFEFPSSWFQSLNPLYVMALAPVAAWLWIWLNKRGKEPSTISKFANGVFLIGISFFVMMLAQAAASGDAKVTPLWLCSVYLIQTIGELTLSPVGLSLTTKLAPEKYGSQMMGVWFLAVTARRLGHRPAPADRRADRHGVLVRLPGGARRPRGRRGLRVPQEGQAADGWRALTLRLAT